MPIGFRRKREQKLAIIEGIGDVCSLIGKYDEAIQSYESAIKFSEDRKKKADIYRKVASIYSAKLQPDSVLKYVDIAIEELGEDTQSVEMARICNVAMDLFTPPSSFCDYDKAFEYGFKSLSIVEGTEHKMELAEAYSIMSENYVWIRDYDKGIQYAQKVLTIGQEINNTSLLALAHWIIGFAHQKSTPDWRIAVNYYNESIKLYKKIGDIYNMAWGYLQLGYTYYSIARDYESAIKCFKTCIKLDEEKKFPINTGRAMVHLSQTYRNMGEWDEAINHAQEALHIGTTIGRDDSWIESNAYLVLMEAYLAKGELDKALFYIKESVNFSIDLSSSGIVNEYLVFVEDICQRTGNHAEFASFCQEIIEKHAEELKEMTLDQWYLEPKELSGQFTQIAFLDDFDGTILCPEWQWIDPKGNCHCEFKVTWLRIQADSECNLWVPNNLDAPRLLRWISGDFAIETQIAIDEDIPAVGGLLVWKDIDNFIRFEKGMRGRNNIELSGNVNDTGNFFGRGMLVSDTIYMRIERIGDTLSAYCSKDGENWLTCGQVEFPVDDPIQIGVHAIGNIGAQKGNMLDMSTATRFDYFKIYRPDGQPDS